MPTQKQIEAMNGYAAIMGEIKLRISIAESVLLNSNKLPPLIVKENCHLQFRLICELIAIACLVAHGDIADVSKSKLQSAYAADYIVNSLKKLHPDFYPVPSSRTKSENIWHLEPISAPHLDRDKLVGLTHECGRVLHRGNIKKLLNKNNPIQYNFPEMRKTLQEIVNLLDNHNIRLVGGDVMLCVMDDGVTHDVQVAFAEQLPNRT